MNNASIKMSSKTAGKIGLFGAISVIVGGIIGIGIFFKNNNIFRNNNNNATGVLLSWIITVLIALATAYSYGEIVSVKDKTANSGLGGWSNKFVGNAMGRFVKINQPYLYYAVYVFCASIFAAEAIANVFVSAPGHLGASIKMWHIVLIALGVTVLFLTTNAFCGGLNRTFSKITSPIKFIPLLLVIALGVIFGILYGQHNLFSGADPFHPDDKPVPNNFSFTGMLTSMPAILFALDSFLIVGNIAGDVKDRERNVPLSIIISMILSGAVYILVTIGQIMTGCGSAYDIIRFVFNRGDYNNGAVNLGGKICLIIISVFILIAIFGVANSLSMACIAGSNAAVDENVIVGSKTLKKWGNGHKNLPGFIAGGIVVISLYLLIGLPSIIINTDQLVDGLSNIIVLFFFVIYGAVAIASAINRRTKKVTGLIESKGQVWIAWIAGIGCILIALYAFIFTNLYDPIIHPSDPNKSWGLFLEDTHSLTKMVSAIFFWSVGIIFIITPFINDLLIKKFNPKYNQPYIWERVR